MWGVKYFLQQTMLVHFLNEQIEAKSFVSLEQVTYLWSSYIIWLVFLCPNIKSSFITYYEIDIGFV